MRRLFVLLLLTLPAGTAVAEKYYKWQDADGAWHYTTTPPPADRAASEVRVERREPEAPPAAAAPATPAPAAAAARDGGPKLTEAQAAQARRASCEQARRNVQTMQNSTVVRMDLDGDGTPETLDDAQLQAQLARARQQVQQFCDPGG